mmetsp:Transcript_8072/g.20084  ORF Transcript_8072/g.20084 Transcript_8072/m.20084 type:complete len:151 (+) Transcript_8072:637-1089(+)
MTAKAFITTMLNANKLTNPTRKIALSQHGWRCPLGTSGTVLLELYAYIDKANKKNTWVNEKTGCSSGVTFETEATAQGARTARATCAATMAPKLQDHRCPSSIQPYNVSSKAVPANFGMEIASSTVFGDMVWPKAVTRETACGEHEVQVL